MRSAALQSLVDAGIAVPVRYSPYVRDTGSLSGGGSECASDLYPLSVEFGTVVAYVLEGPWSGSDYSGDSFTESNCRSLLRDFPSELISLYGPYDEYGLAVPVDFDNAHLAEVLRWVRHDEPWYDPEDESELLRERARQAWGAYLRRDLESDLEDVIAPVLDRSGDGDAVVHLSKLEAEFWELCGEFEIEYIGEGARDVVLRGAGDQEFRSALLGLAFAGGGVDFDRDCECLAQMAQDRRLRGLRDVRLTLLGCATCYAEIYPYARS